MPKVHDICFSGRRADTCGLDFYKELVEYQKKYNSKNIKVNNSIQTNGMVIDEQWSRFLAAGKFLVGISLDWYLGNIRDTGFDEMKNSRNGTGFVEVSKIIDPECRECRHFQLCRGGCRRTREPFENGRPVLNYYCSAYKDFFDYSGERLKRMAQYLMVRNG
ncbi:SPASM domain-containing protein [Ruminiclostridium cellobioparum]|uniref:SPASM domain-containing protein n=1 Tax=Ruminiclostridium cellobioparum TaxID=29355 RepID=UPI0028B24180|nr:SPASM domain-containing protein [Ruminiclostridium cellobioparum]